MTDKATNTTAYTRQTAHSLFNGKTDTSSFDFTGLSKNEKNEYSTVTFVDEDGNKILERTDYLNGETPAFNGNAPIKESDAQYTYEFAGWSPEIGTVDGNVTYTAIYTATEIVIDDDDDEDGTVVPDSGSSDGNATPAAPAASDSAENNAPAAAATTVNEAITTTATVNRTAARPATAGIIRTAAAPAATVIADGQVPMSEKSVQIDDQKSPLADAAPQDAETVDHMKVLPAIIVALGIALALFFRKKGDEEESENL